MLFCSAGKYIFLTNENIILLLISYIVKIDIPLYIQCTCIQYSVQKEENIQPNNEKPNAE